MVQSMLHRVRLWTITYGHKYKIIIVISEPWFWSKELIEAEIFSSFRDSKLHVIGTSLLFSSTYQNLNFKVVRLLNFHIRNLTILSIWTSYSIVHEIVHLDLKFPVWEICMCFEIIWKVHRNQSYSTPKSWL